MSNPTTGKDYVERFITTETLVIELLLIVSLVAIAVRRLRVPYTVAPVIVGLALTTQQPLKLDSDAGADPGAAGAAAGV